MSVEKERHGLLTIAEHCERLAVYKELTSASAATKNVGPHSTADEDAAWQAVGAAGQASFLINLKKAPATDSSGDDDWFAHGDPPTFAPQTWRSLGPLNE